jgi:tRNA dimethylallyltransferase
MQTIYIVGPTAVGKTGVAIQLAGLLGAEIVSADSMQVYRGMDIGTGKATPEERSVVPHHLLDVCEPQEMFDVRRYVDLAGSAIGQIHARHRVALVVGGTGLYVRSLRFGLFDGPSRNPALRRKLEACSAGELFTVLSLVDPATAARIDRYNPRRLVRALEVFYTTGLSITDQQADTPGRGATYPGRLFVLERDRADLYRRIEARIDQQMADGWLDEVRSLLRRGLPPKATAMQAAGYRELAAHVRGEMTLPEAVALTKTRTRQLAKRQMTWFRREPQLISVPVEPQETDERVACRLTEMIAAS